MFLEFFGNGRLGACAGLEVRYQAISPAHSELLSQAANPRVTPYRKFQNRNSGLRPPVILHPLPDAEVRGRLFADFAAKANPANSRGVIARDFAFRGRSAVGMVPEAAERLPLRRGC
jgi:hypothetical protein